MPRLPTIRVIGSHDISTRFLVPPLVSLALWVIVAILRIPPLDYE
jgi:hypothetical protein